jgi:hypothetical protein
MVMGMRSILMKCGQTIPIHNWVLVEDIADFKGGLSFKVEIIV